MKRLILMRHAKAERHSTQGTDETRALSRRGIEDAHRVGEFLQKQGYQPSLIIHSTASRTKETAWAICEDLKPAPMAEGLDALYLATETEVLNVIKRAEPTVDILMIVGHNPGIGDLSQTMMNSHEDSLVMDHLLAFPTAAFAVLDLQIDHWAEAKSGHLAGFQIADDLP